MLIRKIRILRIAVFCILLGSASNAAEDKLRNEVPEDNLVSAGLADTLQDENKEKSSTDLTLHQNESLGSDSRKEEAEEYADDVVAQKKGSSVSLSAKEEAVNSKDASKKSPPNPIIVNADRIEYSQDKTTVTAQGNVDLTREGSILTCDNVTVNTQTNDVHAEGNVVFKDKQGVIKARTFDYNFKTKTGQGFDGKVYYPPYYGAGKIFRKVSENEIEIKNGYMTTCDREHPHYRMQSRLSRILPQDKVTTKAMTFRVGDTPIMFMPKYTQNLKDDRMHVQVTPGKSRDWGLFILTAWRYDLLNNSGGRINFDLREKRGIAWGVDNYYDTNIVGKGYFKTYYMQEKKYWFNHFYDQFFKEKKGRMTIEKERYRIQWRHKWEVDKDTYAMMEYHKVRDPDFIKDYFLRESEKYKKESVNSSYILLTHNFPEIASMSIVVQKRTNRIFTETERLPEITLEKPSSQIFESPVYFNNTTSYANFNQKYSTIPSPTDRRDNNQRVDNYTRFSLPLKLFFIDVNPYAGNRETYYRRIIDRGDEGVFREVWDSGVDLTTRFYRIFDVNADIWGIKINKLRHVIGPNVTYGYTHPPTVSSSKLFPDGGISESNSMTLSLENKLQTKRDNKTVDFLRFIGSSDYSFNIEGRRHKWNDNIVFDLEMLPYDWLRFESDATFYRKKRYFSAANFDLKASGEDFAWGGGYRYERKSSSQFTGEILCNLFKGWSVKVYERFEFKGNTLVKEQTYSVSRDLHCWILDVNYNVIRGKGETIWFAIRLKAFPDLSLDYNQSYHEPKPGSQGYINQ